jgi:hypothetical protein
MPLCELQNINAKAGSRVGKPRSGTTTKLLWEQNDSQAGEEAERRPGERQNDEGSTTGGARRGVEARTTNAQASTTRAARLGQHDQASATARRRQCDEAKHDRGARRRRDERCANAGGWRGRARGPNVNAIGKSPLVCRETLCDSDPPARIRNFDVYGQGYKVCDERTVQKTQH